MRAPLRIVLVRSRNPLNIGAAARAMANFGLSDLVAVRPYGPSWREAKSAVGAEALLASARVLPLHEAVADCHLVLGTTAARRRSMRRPIVPLPDLPAYLAEHLPTGRAAILFGSEKTGLSNDELGVCRAVVTIPSSEATPSMNLGQAVAVVAYELARARRAAPAVPSERDEPPTERQLEDLIAKALAAFERVDYMRDLPFRVRAGKLRRRLLALRLKKSDAALAQAFLKRVADRS